MSYRLVYTQKAVRDIDRLDTGVKKRIGTTLLCFKNNPLLYSERMTDPELGGYRFRIGDYRVIFDIEGNDIVVLRAGHRSQRQRKRRQRRPLKRPRTD